MSERSIVVLKFGGSVLRSDDDLGRVAAVISKFVSKGARVITVVSAFRGTTDRLHRRGLALSCNGGDVGRRPGNPEALAALLATGETTTAALLSLSLSASGVPTRLLTGERLGIRVDGDLLDGTPAGINFQDWDDLFSVDEVAVVPGFAAVSASSQPALLGRGGSDLTAILLAAETDADRCILFKDVGAWYVEDPLVDGASSSYRALSWTDAAACEVQVVQPKAVRLAYELGRPFEVAALDGSERTIVGPVETCVAGLEQHVAVVPESSSHYQNDKRRQEAA